MPKRRALPTDPADLQRTEQRQRAVTPYQAVMEAAPFEEPDTSQLELLKLRELLEDALEALDPEEKRLINALLVEKRPLRELSRMLGIPKTSLARIRDSAIGKLRYVLRDEPLILEYLNR